VAASEITKKPPATADPLPAGKRVCGAADCCGWHPHSGGRSVFGAVCTPDGGFATMEAGDGDEPMQGGAGEHALGATGAGGGVAAPRSTPAKKAPAAKAGGGPKTKEAAVVSDTATAAALVVYVHGAPACALVEAVTATYHHLTSLSGSSGGAIKAPLRANVERTLRDWFSLELPQAPGSGSKKGAAASDAKRKDKVWTVNAVGATAAGFADVAAAAVAAASATVKLAPEGKAAKGSESTSPASKPTKAGKSPGGGGGGGGGVAALLASPAAQPRKPDADPADASPAAPDEPSVPDSRLAGRLEELVAVTRAAAVRYCHLTLQGEPDAGGGAVAVAPVVLPAVPTVGALEARACSLAATLLPTLVAAGGDLPSLLTPAALGVAPPIDAGGPFSAASDVPALCAAALAAGGTVDVLPGPLLARYVHGSGATLTQLATGIVAKLAAAGMTISAEAVKARVLMVAERRAYGFKPPAGTSTAQRSDDDSHPACLWRWEVTNRDHLLIGGSPAAGGSSSGGAMPAAAAAAPVDDDDDDDDDDGAAEGGGTEKGKARRPRAAGDRTLLRKATADEKVLKLCAARLTALAGLTDLLLHAPGPRSTAKAAESWAAKVTSAEERALKAARDGLALLEVQAAKAAGRKVGVRAPPKAAAIAAANTKSIMAFFGKPPAAAATAPSTAAAGSKPASAVGGAESSAAVLVPRPTPVGGVKVLAPSGTVGALGTAGVGAGGPAFVPPPQPTGLPNTPWGKAAQRRRQQAAARAADPAVQAAATAAVVGADDAARQESESAVPRDFLAWCIACAQERRQEAALRRRTRSSALRRAINTVRRNRGENVVDLTQDSDREEGDEGAAEAGLSGARYLTLHRAEIPAGATREVVSATGVARVKLLSLHDSPRPAYFGTWSAAAARRRRAAELSSTGGGGGDAAAAPPTAQEALDEERMFGVRQSAAATAGATTPAGQGEGGTAADGATAAGPYISLKPRGGLIDTTARLTARRPWRADLSLFQYDVDSEVEWEEEGGDDNVTDLEAASEGEEEEEGAKRETGKVDAAEYDYEDGWMCADDEAIGEEGVAAEDGEPGPGDEGDAAEGEGGGKPAAPAGGGKAGSTKAPFHVVWEGRSCRVVATAAAVGAPGIPSANPPPPPWLAPHVPSSAWVTDLRAPGADGSVEVLLGYGAAEYAAWHASATFPATMRRNVTRFKAWFKETAGMAVEPNASHGAGSTVIALPAPVAAEGGALPEVSVRGSGAPGRASRLLPAHLLPLLVEVVHGFGGGVDGLKQRWKAALTARGLPEDTVSMAQLEDKIHDIAPKVKCAPIPVAGTPTKAASTASGSTPTVPADAYVRAALWCEAGGASPAALPLSAAAFARARFVVTDAVLTAVGWSLPARLATEVGRHIAILTPPTPVSASKRATRATAAATATPDSAVAGTDGAAAVAVTGVKRTRQGAPKHSGDADGGAASPAAAGAGAGDVASEGMDETNGGSDSPRAPPDAPAAAVSMDVDA